MIVLNNDIFLLDELHNDGSKISARLEVNKNSPIFEGHFPGQPVVPGACILQLIKDILEDSLANSLQLKKADHLKFTSMITPVNDELLTLDIFYSYIENQSIKTIAKLNNSTGVCFKFQGEFVRP